MMHCIARNAITCVALITALLAATGPAPDTDLTGQASVIDGDPIKTHTRFSRWAKSGEYAMIDSTIVRAHEHSAGAQIKTVKTKRSGAAKAD